MVEEYKIIKGFENYEVSNFGNVKNIKTGKILKPVINGRGYYHVTLYKDCKKFTKRIHKLVATAFLPNPFKKSCVDHIDNNILNNNINNLRFATSSENGMNRKIGTNNTSGFKGITFHKKSNKWHAHIKINGKYKNLGYFENIEEAVDARFKKATELFGEFKNECEKDINININIPANTKVNLNINIKTEDELEIEQLEKELNDIINRK
jgi:hypothetical protein